MTNLEFEEQYEACILQLIATLLQIIHRIGLAIPEDGNINKMGVYVHQ